MREYYAIRVRLDARERWLLWFTNEVDGVVLDDAGKLVAFETRLSVAEYAERSGFAAAENVVDYDFDGLQAWLAAPRADAVDCVAFLNAWNLFIDLRSTIAGRDVARDPDDGLAVYNKLFWGNNLPAVTPDGERYEPVWSADEIATLARVLGDGLQLFRATLR